MGGLWEIILCTAVLLLAPSMPLLTAAMWIGILEGGQIAACRPFIADISKVQNVNICDYLTNLPIGATMTGLYVLIVCWAIGKEWRDKA